MIADQEFTVSSKRAKETASGLLDNNNDFVVKLDSDETNLSTDVASN